MKAILNSSAGEASETLFRFYLATSGWGKVGELPGRATIWRHERDSDDERDPDDEFEIVLPFQGEVRDYNDRIANLLSTLARFEGRSEQSVLADVILRERDLIKVRVAHPDVSQGNIPLNDGVILHEKARELLAAAAQSAISRKRHYSGPRPDAATEFLNELQLGQSEVGSYIVNVFAPLVTKRTHQMELESVPFARAVTANLSRALSL